MNINRISHSNVLFFVLALLILSAPAHARTTKLVEPAPVKTNCILLLEKMKEAITTGGAVRGWVVVSQAPGTTELKYVKGAYKHVISVNVNYTKNTFAITYKDSTNLNYKVKRNGDRVIHPRPIGWMKNLSIDIQTKTDILCSE
jgi:hypothetical protein